MRPRRYLDSQRMLNRFSREAKVLEELRHDNIARAIAFGIEEYIAFIAMEYAPGISLSESWRRSRSRRRSATSGGRRKGSHYIDQPFIRGSDGWGFTARAPSNTLTKEWVESRQ